MYNYTDNISYFQNESQMGYENAIMYMNIIAVPCIVMIGICGNTLSFIVFVMTHLKYKSSSIYLASLNVVDTGFLVSLLPAWLGWVHVDIFHMQGWCQTTIYAAYVFAFTSVYIVVAFTIERFVVVFYPLKRSVICTVKRALYIILAIFAIACVMYSYALWTTSVQLYQEWPTCMSKPQFADALHVLSAVDTFVTLIVPSVAIILFNGSIAIKLILYYRSKHQRQPQQKVTTQVATMYKSTSSDSDPRGHDLAEAEGGPCQRLYNSTENTGGSRKSRSLISTVSLTSSQSQRQRNFQNRTTRTLLIISTVFILLNLPSHAFRVYAVAMALANTHYRMSHLTELVQELCLLLHYANFASNLFLYTLCSRSFRLALLKLWGRLKRKLVCLSDHMGPRSIGARDHKLLPRLPPVAATRGRHRADESRRPMWGLNKPISVVDRERAKRRDMAT